MEDGGLQKSTTVADAIVVIRIEGIKITPDGIIALLVFCPTPIGTWLCIFIIAR